MLLWMRSDAAMQPVLLRLLTAGYIWLPNLSAQVSDLGVGSKFTLGG